MMEDDIEWLINWYNHQCNGDWKIGNRISIQTLGNPGWDLQVHLEETGLIGQPFQKVSIDYSEHDWIRCFVENLTFYGVGGPFNLLDVFAIFRKWTEDCQKENEFKNVKDLEASQLPNGVRSFFQTGDNHLMWLIKWFHNHCDGFWEDANSVRILTIDPGWYVRISIDETEFDDIQFPEVVVNRSEDDWIHCFIRRREFIGLGGPSNLLEILQVFRNWSESFPERDFSEEET